MKVRSYPPHMKEIACTRYASGLTAKQVAEQLGVSQESIFRWIAQVGLRRGRNWGNLQKIEKHPIVWGELTPERAWVLGVIFGDGGIKKDGRDVHITTSDEDILTKTMAILKHWPKLGSGQGCQRLTISSRKFVAMLKADYSLDETKCATMRWPNIPNDMIPHFIRGLIDSDGSWHQRIGRQSRQLILSYVSICGDFVRSLEATLSGLQIVGPHRVYEKPSRISRFGARTAVGRPTFALEYGHIDCVTIGGWIYTQGTEHMRCERKYRYWLERADAYVAPGYVLRHDRRRAKLLGQIKSP